jgi:hypothetical protein
MTRPTTHGAAPPWLPPTIEEDGVDPTLLCALADAGLGWGLVLRAEPVDEVPHIVATLTGMAGGAPMVSALEVAQVRTPLSAAQRWTPHALRELAMWLRRFDQACARRHMFRPLRPGAFAIPLVEVAPGQVVGYRARLWRGDVLLASMHGAFCIAEGQVILW